MRIIDAAVIQPAIGIEFQKPQRGRRELLHAENRESQALREHMLMTVLQVLPWPACSVAASYAIQ